MFSKLGLKLRSKFKVEYDPYDIVPFYKGYWYRDPVKDKIYTTLIPLNILFRFPLVFYRSLRDFGFEGDGFYHIQKQLRLRKKIIKTIRSKPFVNKNHHLTTKKPQSNQD